MDKFLSRFRKTKKSNKENTGSGIDRHALRVNFESPAGPIYSNGAAKRNHSYLNDSEDDGERSGSEVTLKVPTNPYHVITEPKTRKGPRSCPGAVSDNSRRPFGSRRRHGRPMTTLDDSFRSEFVTSNDVGYRRSSGTHRNHDERRPTGVRQPLRETENIAVEGEMGGPTNLQPIGSSSQYGRKVKSWEELSEDGGEEAEWSNNYPGTRMQRYEQKCRKLGDTLQIALNNERIARRKKTYYQKLSEDMEKKNMRMQIELEQLRTTIYGLQMELQRSRMLLSQRDDFCSSLCRQAMNNSWLTAQSSRRFPQQQYGQQPMMNASPCHHTLGSMLSNTATPSSTNNDIRAVAAAAAAAGLTTAQINSLPPISDDVANSRMIGGGGGEGMAEISLSSLGVSGDHNHRPNHELGNIERLIASLNVNQASLDIHHQHHQHGAPHTSSTAKKAPSGTHENPNNLLTVRTASSDGNGSDEVKNFRRQHQDSFSGSSSRPGEVVTLELWGKLQTGQLPIAISVTRFDSDTSSLLDNLEGNRGGIGDKGPDTSALQISASCDARLDNALENGGGSGLLIKDEGYSTSGTLQSSLRAPNSNPFCGFCAANSSSQTLMDSAATPSSHSNDARRRSRSA